MKAHWLIDAEMFPHYRDQLVAEIRAHGHDVKLIHAPSPPYRWDDVTHSYPQYFPKDACVIAHGDIELVSRIHRERRWAPGAFCTVENFECSSYFCWFGEYLLNCDYVMMPFGELRRRKDFLFETFGRSGSIFVRPNSPLKLFTGQLAKIDTFDADVEFMGFYDFPKSSIVVVSSPKTILSEWRFVVANKKVIAGSQYKLNDKLDQWPARDDHAFDLASKIASTDHQPDPVWIVDICKTANNSYHLMEIGGFSFCDLYACDKSSIASEVSKAAIAEWEKAQA